MSAAKPALENVRAFNSYRYIVWTQAGFKQACKMLYRATGDGEEAKEDRLPVEGYPLQYPALVVFSGGYRGYHYWEATCTPLSQAIERARAQLAFLEEADAHHRAAIANAVGGAS